MNRIYRLFNVFSLGSEEDKKKIYFIIFITFICSILEIIAITNLYNFLNLIANNDISSKSQAIYSFLNIKIENIYYFTLICFFVFIVLSSIFRILLIKKQSFLACDFGVSLANKTFKNILNRDYEFHITKNSSEYLSAIVNKINDVTNKCLIPIINVFSSFILLFFMMLTLLVIEPIPSIVTISILTLVYLLIASFFKKKMLSYGQLMSKRYSEIIKFLQETFQGIRDVIISGNEKEKINEYLQLDKSLRLAQANVNYISAFPRYVVETVIIILIGVVVVVFYENNINDIIPIAGTMVVVMQRSLPMFNQIYASVNSFRSGKAALEDLRPYFEAVEDNNDLNNNKKFLFKEKIEFCNINYSYPQTSKKIFHNLSLKIIKNKFYGIRGITGAGKSTFVDLFSGLLKNYDGKIFIDDKLLDKDNNKLWQKNISYISQKLFLYDDSLLNNLTNFHEHDFDEKKLFEILKMVNLQEFINKLPNKLNTIVGENAIKLSGGQRQRISLAKAIYADKPVLILDEATNALDEKTENNILNNIKKLNKTIIMITHSSDNLKLCDHIIEINSNDTFLK